jgi:hypothetical protein
MNNELAPIECLLEWVRHDETKEATAFWSAEYPPTRIPRDDHGVFDVLRTRAITPEAFKQHNHG